MTTTEIPAAPTSVDARPTRWHWWWSLVALGMVAAVALVWVLISRRGGHSDTLNPYYGVNEIGRFPVGVSALLAANVEPRGKTGHRVVDLRAVTPRITVNTSHATVRVMECTVADPNMGVGMTTLAYARPICATLRPFRPGRVDLGFPTTEIAYIVTATTPGRVRIDGADVTYVDGIRAGEQHAGSGLVVHAKPAKS